MIRTTLSILLLILLTLMVLPATAQDDPHKVSFNGVEFSFAPAFANNVNIRRFSNDEFSPSFDEFAVFNSEGVAAIPLIIVRVFSAEAVSEYPVYEDQWAALQTLLDERPDLSGYMEVDENNVSGQALPYLPMMRAAQVIRAKAVYVDTDFVSGISYLAVYRQDAFPFVSTDFSYKFQGISVDGMRYISVTMLLRTDLFPDEVPADFDFDTFYADLFGYYSESAATLDSANPNTDFSPPLSLMDALVESITLSD